MVIQNIACNAIVPQFALTNSLVLYFLYRIVKIYPPNIAKMAAEMRIKLSSTLFASKYVEIIDSNKIVK